MNRGRLIAVVSLLVPVALVTLPLEGQEATRNDEIVAIYHAKHSPAVDLGQTLAKFLGDASDASTGEEPVIVPEPITNSLLVRGDATVVKRIHEMLGQLDRKPASVFVEIVIVKVQSDKEPGRIAVRSDGGTTSHELIDKLSQQGRSQVLARAQLMALHNQSASLHIGGRKPRVVNARESSGRVTRSVELENVGLVVGLTPRISPGGCVTMELDLERSDLAVTDDGVELLSDGDQAAEVATLSLQTTLCVQSGRTVVLGGQTEGGDGKWQKLLALLTATVIE
jgi:type II secretory pathway component GspD/PulD (secretin)